MGFLSRQPNSNDPKPLDQDRISRILGSAYKPVDPGKSLVEQYVEGKANAAKESTPFVFIDEIEDKPYKAVMLGGDWWFCYWHEGQQSWVTMCRAEDNKVAYWRERALPAEQAKFYDDLHAKFESNSVL